ncbi:hypothetical protein DEFDS_P157 (plasmid) [Deferribacter desulfuricans SSM1]|uniref:Uncharacterized protein n=1 Tax=Deferribacter desulfuricans (strain DSM 14783 / JCM 11476 / NBRC 101012 / SSM1) TaxID=639282 RepID=D3PEY6_DEFDS|nr:hypothetical protein [Deferribacter desulfuricans]BAI81778.1 hypothetical protein DEFDS_P157 [Deferribacter desulfuricans SSM1]
MSEPKYYQDYKDRIEQERYLKNLAYLYRSIKGIISDIQAIIDGDDNPIEYINDMEDNIQSVENMLENIFNIKLSIKDYILQNKYQQLIQLLENSSKNIMKAYIQEKNKCDEQTWKYYWHEYNYSDPSL